MAKFLVIYATKHGQTKKIATFIEQQIRSDGHASTLINIDEIWLKGKNRRWYIEQLRNHILNVFHAYQGKTVRLQEQGPKFFITAEEIIQEPTLAALAKICGTSSTDCAK